MFERKAVMVKQVDIFSDGNLSNRAYMEDFTSVLKIWFKNRYYKFYVLCDGHGGSEAAKAVLENFKDLFEEIHENNPSEGIFWTFSATFEKLDKTLHVLGIKKSGTTINIVFILNENGFDNLYSVNLGDSKAILVSSTGGTELSSEHKPSLPSEIDRIRSEGGNIINGRLAGKFSLSRALGNLETKSIHPGMSITPHVSRAQLDSLDRFVILCSDGVTDVISNGEMVNCIDFWEASNSIRKESTIAEFICNVALFRGSMDNVTCMVLTLGGA